MIYLLKHPRPKLLNPIKELSTCAIRSNDKILKNWKIIKLIINNPDIELKFKPKIKFDKNDKIKYKLIEIKPKKLLAC